MKKDLKTKVLFIFLIPVSIINAQTSIVNTQKLQKQFLTAIRRAITTEVRNLIKKGAQVNVKIGIPPLIVAAKNTTTQNDKRMATITKELLRKKASPIKRDRFQKTPLIWAAENGAYRVLKELLRTKEGKAAINMQGRGGNTALIVATMAKTTGKGRLKIAKQLLAKGADPTIRNTRGKSALFYAKQANDMEMIKLLRSYMPKRLIKPGLERKPIRRYKKPGPPMTTMPIPLPRYETK